MADLNRSVLASAAAGVASLIHGQEQRGVVLGVVSEAVIVSVPTEDGVRVLCLLSAKATGVPNGVRLMEPLNGPRPGDPVRVGGGQVAAGGLAVTVVRTWPSAVHPVTGQHDLVRGWAELTAAIGTADRGIPLGAVDELDLALQLDRGIGHAVDGLLGLGSGLTPGGDDVIAGMLIGLHAIGRPALAHRVGAIDQLTERTTTLSADLIRLAAAGHGCLEVLGLLSALRAGAPLHAPIDRLLSVGHTSGADLATGLAIGLRVGATRQEAK